MATTALVLIASAMSKIGKLAAGETVSSEDAAVCVERLNALTTSLEAEGLFSYAMTRTVATLAANTTSLTIGPAMQIAMVRPVKLLKGSFGRVSGIDYAIEPIAEAEYNAISLKSQIGSVAPAVCFYDGGLPTGIVYFWPYAGTSVELHLLSPATQGIAVTSNSTFDFPPGYQRMFEYNLAVDIAPDFQVVPSVLVVSMAAASRRALRRNAPVAQLRFDVQMNAGRGRSPSEFISGY